MSRIVIASGGTGGHFYPGFSLGAALREKGHEVLFLVRKDDPALSVLEKEDFPALPIDVTGMPRRLSPRLFTFFWKLGGSVGALRRAFAAWKPDAVVGMGAYVSFPAVLLAWWRGVPSLVHESNATFGLANKLSLFFVRAACLGLPMEPKRSERDVRWVLTGTPIRQSLWQREDAATARRSLGLAPERKTVLVAGGSQGAAAINAALPAALAAAAEKLPGGLQVLHLAGAGKEKAVELAYREMEVPAVVLPFLDRMELAFAAADVAVCRSGASTLAELIAQRIPAILIPFPSAAGDHQTANARLLERAGAATVIAEKDLSTHGLSARIVDAFESGSAKLLAMKAAYEGLQIPRGQAAVEALVDAVEECLKR